MDLAVDSDRPLLVEDEEADLAATAGASFVVLLLSICWNLSSFSLDVEAFISFLLPSIVDVALVVALAHRLKQIGLLCLRLLRGMCRLGLQLRYLRQTSSFTPNFANGRGW
jgi:hypothetical protein